MKVTKEEKARSIAVLAELLKPKTDVYTRITHCSRSGMLRHVRVNMVEEGQITDITYHVARACGYNMDDKGIKVPGCGFDAGFDVVYSIGATLWPQGTPKPHGTRNGEPDTSGGYALKHRSL